MMNESWMGDCTRIQDKFPEPVDILWVKALFGAGYSLVMGLGLLGNFLTIYCIFALKVSVGIDWGFILSLSLSNVVMDVTSLPFTGLQIFSRTWEWGSGLCQAVPLAQASGTFVSSFTLMGIAFDRYVKIRDMGAGSAEGGGGRRALAVAGMWGLAVAVSLPYAVFMRHIAYDSYCGHFCEESWPGGGWSKAYAASVLFIQFLLPLIVLLYCYGMLRRTVAESVRRRLTQRLTEEARSRVIARQAKTSKITSLLFLGFIGPWLPFNVLAVSRDYDLIHPDYFSLAFGAVHLVAMTSTMWNPIIYCWLNSEMQAALRRCCCPESLVAGPGAGTKAKSLLTGPTSVPAPAKAPNPPPILLSPPSNSEAQHLL